MGGGCPAFSLLMDPLSLAMFLLATDELFLHMAVLVESPFCVSSQKEGCTASRSMQKVDLHLRLKGRMESLPKAVRLADRHSTNGRLHMLNTLIDAEYINRKFGVLPRTVKI